MPSRRRLDVGLGSSRWGLVGIVDHKDDLKTREQTHHGCDDSIDEAFLDVFLDPNAVSRRATYIYTTACRSRSNITTMAEENKTPEALVEKDVEGESKH